MWLTAEGKRVEYAEDIFTIEEKKGGKALSLLCPTRNVRSRGDILNLSTLTLVSQMMVYLLVVS
jgi:alpha-D-xyloside xylohydrolase